MTKQGFWAHPSAIVDEGATVGAGTKIWHFSHVCKDSDIGEDCSFGQNVYVGPHTKVGAGSRIQNNVSIYDEVYLDEDVFVGPSAVFTNVINPRAHVPRKHEYKKTFVRRGATIGANATIVCGNDIGAYALVGAGAVVNRAVPAHALVVGTPARQIGWMSHDGERLGDDLVCPRSGRRYAERHGELVELTEPDPAGS
jgi:UDP-2-acetamido-3-amino-2,3-dideoxy-glucuronate N-acetyltransferase